MKQALLIPSILTIAFLISVSTFPASAGGMKSVSALNAVGILASEPNVVVLDVRTQEEFVGPLGHLKGAELLPIQELHQRVGELQKYRDKKILVICHSGGRSSRATRFLAGKGFNVINVEGGMVEMNQIPSAPIER